MALSLGLDIGTSKLCAAAFDPEGAVVLAQRSSANDSGTSGLPTGHHEQDPARIWELCLSLLGDLLADPSVDPRKVDSIGISGQMHGVLLADPKNRPITNLITWRDRRERKPSRGSMGTGCRLCEGYGALTLGWLARNGHIPVDAQAVSIGDFIAASLTGTIATSQYMAASWGILDLRQGRYDRTLAGTLSIPAGVMPPIHDDSPLGAVKPEIASTLGLGAGVKVFPPLGDNQASVLGAVGIDMDSMVVNIGTGGQVSIPVKRLEFVRGLETRPMPGGRYILVGASLCGGWSYSYLMRFLQATVRDIAGANLDETAIYKELNRLLERTNPGAEGLATDVRFMGTRDDPSARGGISGIDDRNLTPGNLARSFLEGIASELAALAKPAGATGIKRIAATGNAVRKIPVMKQVLSDAFGMECFLPPYVEEAAVGAARHAAGVI